jgi:hypothetical protein
MVLYTTFFLGNYIRLYIFSHTATPSVPTPHTLITEKSHLYVWRAGHNAHIHLRRTLPSGPQRLSFFAPPAAAGGIYCPSPPPAPSTPCLEGKSRLSEAFNGFNSGAFS